MVRLAILAHNPEKNQQKVLNFKYIKIEEGQNLQFGP
jgi:hypothetical protein